VLCIEFEYTVRKKDLVLHLPFLFKGLGPSNDCTIDTIKGLFTDTRSRVLHSGLQSSEFVVRQGCPQDRKCFPIMYLVFIGGPIRAIDIEVGWASTFMARIWIRLQWQMVMLLLSFSKAGMDGILDIFWEYSKLWGFFYNQDKCKVLLFNARKKPQQGRFFKLGHSVISETDSYNRLSNPLDAHLSAKSNITQACNKLRGTYLNIWVSGIHPTFM